MSYGIILIDYNKATTDNQIQNLVSSFYKDNEKAIDGMTYYETDHKDLIVDIKSMCLDQPEKPSQKMRPTNEASLSQFVTA